MQQAGEAQLLGIEAATGYLLSTAEAAAGLQPLAGSLAHQNIARLLPYAGPLHLLGAVLVPA